MQQLYQDSMAMVSALGKPSYFTKLSIIMVWKKKGEQYLIRSNISELYQSCFTKAQK
jgi:hypothetical protein